MHVIMSHDVLSALRHRISELLPQVKSAKLAEAVAAGFKFKTNASFVAALKSDDLSSFPVSEFHPADFYSRLKELGYEDGIPSLDVLKTAFDRSPCLWHFDRMSEDHAPPLAEIHQRGLSGNWSNLKTYEAVLLTVARFVFRDDGTVTPARFGLESGSAGPGQLDLRILSIWKKMRDIDRPVADFLYDWMASGIYDDDEDASLWGVPIFPVMFVRIERLMRGIHATWSEDEPLPAPEKGFELLDRPKRPFALTNTRSIRDGEFGLYSIGKLEPGYRTVVGLLSFGLWLSGYEHSDIESLVSDCMDSDNFQASVLKLFPDSEPAALATLSGLWNGDVPDWLNHTLITLPDLESLESVRSDLEGAGTVIRPIKAPPGINTSKKREVEFLQSIEDAFLGDLHWFVVNFEGRDSDPRLVDLLCDCCAQFGVGLIAIAPGRNTGPRLSDRMAERSSGRQTRTINLDDETVDAFKEQEAAFVAKFGRKPGPQDPIFFDPDADTPIPLSEKKMRDGMLETMHRSEFPRQFIYAYEKTGLIMMEGKLHLYSDAQQEAYQAAMREYFDRVEAGDDPYEDGGPALSR